MLAEKDVQALKADAISNPNETALRTLLLTINEWDMEKATGRRMNYLYEAIGCLTIL